MHTWKMIGTAAGLGVGFALGRTLVRAARTWSDVPGRDKSAEGILLSAGARVLQRRSPLEQFDTYLAGFHPLRDRPHIQVEAHHYCRVVNDDFIQCVLFDGNGADARLTGIEFIVSEQLYASLPEGEKQYWHPHNYEIFSGQLVAPGLPDPVEDRLMRRMVNSYGKTWHVWLTERDALPLGESCLAWAFTADGQLEPQRERARNERMGIDLEEKRRRRERLRDGAHGQPGIDERVVWR